MSERKMNIMKENYSIPTNTKHAAKLGVTLPKVKK